MPPAAVWAGGPDGGSYILCNVISDRNLNHCTVWNDTTAQVEEEGDYRLLGSNRAATHNELSLRWADRSGRIGLANNKVLAKLNAAKQR